MDEVKTADQIGSNPPTGMSVDGVIVPVKKRTPHHINRHPSASATLMRSAVKKPGKSQKLIESFSAPLTRQDSQLNLPLMAGKVDPGLAKRASTFRPSKQISRFGAALRQADPLTVQPKPEAKLERVKAIAQPAGASLLERAVQNATSHQQPGPTKKELKATRRNPHRRGRAAAYATVGLMGLIVIGYAVYANIPNVMVKVASVRAGFSAVMPNYRPSGFSLASVGYQPGAIKFNFNSNVGNGNYAITERSSNWDSATLVNSVIVPTQGKNYKKVQYAGQDIYLFGKDQASWVTNGIWYTVQGDGNLSTNQLLQLAATL